MVEFKQTKSEFGTYNSVAVPVKSELSQRFNCTQCESRFRKKSHLSEHIDAKHKGLRHPCLKCSSQFSRTSLLRRHIQEVHKATCYICNLESHDEPSNKSHIDSSHVVFKCSECEKTFNTRSHMSFHLKKYHSMQITKVFECTECDQTFDNQNRLRFHTRSVHMNQWHKCSICGKQFDRYDSLTRHVDGVHSTKSECKKCDFIGYKDQLRIHSFNTHTANIIIDQGTETKTFQCIQCESVCKSYNTLMEHINLNHRGIVFQCKQCIAQYSKRYNLKDHVKKEHNSTMCYVCFFETQDEVAMMLHKETNHSKFKCGKCGHFSTGKSSLKQHMDGHLKKERTFDCTDCGKIFKEKRRLRQHISSFHLNQWLKCNLCDSKFDRKDSFMRHILSSVHLKPCKFCDFKGTSTDQLKAHMQSHKLDCDICDFSTYKHAKFLRHITQQHPACLKCPFVAKSKEDFANHIHLVSCDICKQEMTEERMKKHLNHCIKSCEKKVRTQASKESGIPNVYLCNLCNYQATKKAFINMHLENIHKSEESVEVDNPRKETSQPVDNNTNENDFILPQEQSYESDKEVNQEKGESSQKEIDNQNDHGKAVNFSPTIKESVLENKILTIMEQVQSHAQVTCKTRNLQIFPVKMKVIQEKSNGYLNTKLTDGISNLGTAQTVEDGVDGSDESLKDNVMHDDNNGTNEKECPECGFSTDDEDLYHHHQVTDHLLCYLCGFTSEYQKFIFSHMKAIHNIMDFEEEEEVETPGKNISECPICFEKLPSTSTTALRRHRSKVHAGENFRCGKCEKIFSSFKPLLKHLTKFHQPMVIDSKIIYAECLVR